MKKLVAYSSVSHLGFVVLGIFSFTQPGLDGAVYQMLNHGISTGALFLLVGILYERRHSLEIADYGGVATVAPWLSTVFLVTTLASIGLPTLNNFVGEFLVLQGTAIANFTWAVWASLGVILSACYMLWMYQRVFYGEAGARSPLPHPRSQPPRMGGHRPADRHDGVDGRVLAELPPARRQEYRTRLGTDQRERPLPGAVQPASGRSASQADGGRPCPLVRSFNPQDALRFLPEIILTVMGTLLMVLDPLIHKRSSERLRAHQPARAGRRARRQRLRLHHRRTGVRRHADGGWLRHLLPRAGDRGRHPDRLPVLPLPGAAERRDQRISRAAAVLDRRASA